MALAQLFSRVVGDDVPVEFRAYDGSRAGQVGADVRVEIRAPLALSHVAAAPGALGLARAYITGSIDVAGDLHTALAGFPELSLDDIPLAARAELAARLAAYRVWWPVRRPAEEYVNTFWGRLRRHSKSQDQKVISHHYDVSNRFYEWVLGPSMTYTCAVFPEEGSSLEEAQYTKHELVARKLGLRKGMRLLDVGCGWGGMVMHAAKQGVRALGVTLSRQQARWAQKAIAEQGLADLAEVRHLDYRDVVETDFDAISSIGLTEHIGRSQLDPYFSFLYGKLKPGGRLLNHCITRADNSGSSRTNKFITRYIFPDGELESPGTLASAMHDNGFEVRHTENLREHYAKTLTRWSANLDAHWNEAVREVGAVRARTWRLYMVGSRLGFERNNIELHQMLGVRLDDTDAHMPLRPDW